MTYWQKTGMELAGELNKCHHCTFQEGMQILPEKSVNLIFADPSYFEVKGEFDFGFEGKTKQERRQNWLDTLIRPLAESSDRVLADNGAILMYGHALNIAYQQVVFDEFFELENSQTWEKIDSMQYQYYSPKLARSFNTHNERLLYYSREVDQTGLEKIMDEHIKPKHTFAKYLREEFKRAKVANKEIAALFPSRNGGLTGCVSNWLNGDNVMTAEQYEKVKNYLNGDYLRREYEDLRREYEDLRRPFNNPKKLTDVLRYSQEVHITKKYDHPTKKPPTLTRDLLKCTTRKDDIVVIPFSGSGVEAEQCEVLGLDWIAFDIEKKYVDMTNKRAEKIRRGKRFDSQKSKTLPIDFGLFAK